MAKELKEIIVTEFSGCFKGLDSCVLIDYHGLNSEQTVDLRNTLRDSGVHMMVLQNRLAKHALAANEAIPEGFSDLIVGPTAIIYGEGGALSASKSLAGWCKKNKDAAGIKGGLFDGKVLSEASVGELAKIPDRETLLGQVAGMFVSPLVFMASAARDLVSHLASCARSLHEEQDSS